MFLEILQRCSRTFDRRYTCTIIIKKGIPHNYEQNVLWLRAIHDGFVTRKGKRLSPKAPLNEPDYLTHYMKLIKEFVKNQNTKIPNIPELIKATPINEKDKSLELVTEFYLDEKKPSQKEIYEGIDQMVRKSTGYLLSTMTRKEITLSNNTFNQKPYKIKPFNLVDVCNVKREYAPYINEILSDQKITPYVTTTEDNNGISTFCDTEPNFRKNSLTVALDGTCGTTFYQFEDYVAGEKTAVLTLKEKNDPCLLFYIGYLVWNKSWRYHYGRKLSETRLKQFEIDLPVDKNNKIDYNYIDNLVKSCYGWTIISNNI